MSSTRSRKMCQRSCSIPPPPGMPQENLPASFFPRAHESRAAAGSSKRGIQCRELMLGGPARPPRWHSKSCGGPRHAHRPSCAPRVPDSPLSRLGAAPSPRKRWVDFPLNPDFLLNLKLSVQIPATAPPWHSRRKCCLDIPVNLNLARRRLRTGARHRWRPEPTATLMLSHRRRAKHASDAAVAPQTLRTPPTRGLSRPSGHCRPGTRHLRPRRADRATAATDAVSAWDAADPLTALPPPTTSPPRHHRQFHPLLGRRRRRRVAEGPRTSPNTWQMPTTQTATLMPPTL
ncbi:uncharacterized protein LOC144577538 [Callithrix jacchus]